MNNGIGKTKKVTPAGLANLFIVYFIWGSTYLAIRIGIRDGSGFEPFWFGGLRVLTAGILLILWGLLRGKNIRPSKKDLFVLAATGLLLWIGGNGLIGFYYRFQETLKPSYYFAADRIFRNSGSQFPGSNLRCQG